MVILPGLMLAMMLAMLDNMIVGTAMPRIVGELGGLDHLSWVVTAYVLGTTVSTPLWGKIGDLYGRKNIFITSIVIFLVGSALSGMSQSMGELIGFRALQGLGAGGLIVGVMAIIGDLVPPRERGRYQGIMAGIMALAMVAGPLAGGFITDNLNWRWAFYVNLPLGGAALVWLIARLHLPKYRTEHRIDWLGAGLLSVGITSLVLITTWGGGEYAWGSWQIIGLAILSVVTLAVFGFVERRVAEPILSLELFRNRNFALVSAIGFVLGLAMFGAINFLPLYQQTVQGSSATNSGLLLLPMMLAMMAGVDHRGPGHHQDRQVQDVPGHRRPRHDHGHDPAVVRGRGHDQAAAGAVHGGTRPRHGLPDADHDADRPEQRRAEGPGRRQQHGHLLPLDRRLVRVALFGTIFVRHLKDDLTGRLGAAAAGEDDQRRRSGRPEAAADTARRGQGRALPRHRVVAVDGVPVGDPVRGRGGGAGVLHPRDQAARARGHPGAGREEPGRRARLTTPGTTSSNAPIMTRGS
jgi:MFS family permease